MRVLVFASDLLDASAFAELSRAMVGRGHDVDIVSVDSVPVTSSVAIHWRDATSVVTLAGRADAVVHFWHPALRGSVDWATELSGIAVVDGDEELPPLIEAVLPIALGTDVLATRIEALVAAGDPGVGRRAIARAFGPLIAGWSVPADSPFVARLAEELDLFD